MHNWFLIALIAPVLWTIVNHLDKHLLSRYFKGNGAGALFLFSSLFSAFVLPFIAAYEPGIILQPGLVHILILLGIGILNAAAFLLYLLALDKEEPSIIVAFLQLIPVFAFFLGYAVLGETLNGQQAAASAIVVSGVAILSVEFGEGRGVSIKAQVLALVAGASFLYALHDTLFKAVAINGSFTASIFWQYAGCASAGITVYLFYPTYRKEFNDVFRQNDKRVLSLNTFGEVLYILGSLANNFALMLAPVALVLVVASYQPLFVFVGGTLLAIFLPSLAHEKLSRKHTAQKLLSIIIILIGSYLLYNS